MTLSLFDIIIATIFAYLSVSGLLRGFCKEAFGLLGLIGGLWLAYKYYPMLSPHLTFINGETWRIIVAYLIIFLGVNFVASFLAFVMQGLLTLAMLPWADKLAGLILGFGKAVFLCSVITLITQRYFGNADFLQNSFLLPYLTNFIENVRDHIPNEFFNMKF